MTERVRHSLARPWGGPAELALAVSLYALYELVRGFGSTSLSLARAHTADIVALERRLHVFGELSVQRAVDGIPAVPSVLGCLSMSLHLGGTSAALVRVYRRHRDWFPLVRTTIVVSTAISLVIS